MKRFINFFLLLLSLTLFTSCFEILEEITLNSDGSGNMLVTFNLSKSKSKIASIMLLDSVNGYKVPSKEDIGSALKEAKNHLKTIDGISNIKTTTDYDNYIFTISCNFSSTDNIDSVFKDLIRKHNKKSKTNFNTTNFSFNKSTNAFKRSFSYDDRVDLMSLILGKKNITNTIQLSK